MNAVWITPTAGAVVQVLGAMRAESSLGLNFSVPAHAMACFTLVFNGQLEVLEAGVWRAMPKQFANGPFVRPMPLRVSAGTQWTSLFCRADAWPLLSGQRADKFVNRFFSLDEIGPSLSHLRHWVQDGDATARFASGLLERIGEALEKAAPRPGTLLLNQALKTLATQDLSEVQLALGVSERHLQRVFASELGLSAKRLERLARLNRAVQTWDENAADIQSIAELAASLGYADQSHLAREFNLLVGSPPVHLKGHHGEQVLWALRQGSRALAPAIFRKE